VPKAKFFVNSSDSLDQRVDVYVAGKMAVLSRAQVQNLISRGKVIVNGSPSKASHKLREGDRVEVDYRISSPPSIDPENIPVKIFYHDNHIVVLEKPSGMVVHPGAGNLTHTLVNALLFRFPQIQPVGPSERPGIVHRLDKQTSGIMVAALTETAYTELQRQFKAREVEKHYQGLVWGKISSPEGKISWPLGRHMHNGERISVKTRKPREAETKFTVRQNFRQFTLLEIRPITGRMHQIRVHLAASGHPIVGDTVYGRRKNKSRCPRLFLHAARLAFTHPFTQERMEFSSPLPQDLKDFLGRIEKHNLKP
jgi:23S rRNA pseudouridine1911/1915/1917 synthase